MEPRQLENGDYEKGFIELLTQLTTVGNISQENFNLFLKNTQNSIFVIECSNKIIGTISFLIEQKLIHNLGKVLHVEELVIDENFRNNKLGTKLLNLAKKYEQDNECYKIILNCNENNRIFYEYADFSFKNIQMSYYI